MRAADRRGAESAVPRLRLGCCPGAALHRLFLSPAANKDITTQARIERLFKEKGIPYGIWDPKPIFDRYNVLIKEDKIDATPTCVVIMNGQKKAFVGGPDIINALKALP